ncbi:WD-40 repeat-containing protein [Nostoc linckia NIES-25]|nr:WD-40 repeat-containing protein [Nostoc linckia NIES-25]
MAESDGRENILPDNERSLLTLARTVKLTQRRFSLILVRCNYTSLRDQILQRLRQQCSVEFAELVLPSSTTKLYSSILNQVENQPPAALMILGLESVQALDDLLVAANKARDKFKSDFAFPIILWVTDRILHKLGRLAPDFNSWASPPIQFTIASDDMVKSLRQKAEQAFSGDADFSLDGYDLKALQEDLTSDRQASDPELQASLAFMLGLLDYRNNRLDLAIAHYQQSLTYWQQNNNLERQGILLLNIALAYYSKAEQQPIENQTYWEETRSYFQQSLDIFELAQHPELVAKHISQLGEVLRRLKAWQELHQLAHKALKLHQNYDIPNQIPQDYGFLAEVALEQSRWNDAHELVQNALETLEKIPNFLPQEQGKYHLLLAKSLRKLGQINEAVNTLEKAKNESQPQYNPLLYIQILEELHDLKFEQKYYQQAFQLKQKQREIESQYGFRAFIGAGRLQPRRQTINRANSPNQASKDIFGEVVAAFGRQQDIKSLLYRIGRTDCKLTVIYGQSGVGKSSIVQAGLLPVLQLTSFDGLETLPILVQVYTAWEKECGRLLAEKLEEVRGVRLSAPVETSAAIIEQLQQNENRNLVTVLIFDQFEEFFFAYKDQASRRPFYDFLRDCLNISYVKVILSLRQDYLHYLLEWSRTTELPIIDNDILDKNILYYLGNFSPSVAKSVIQSFTKNSQFSLAPDLIDALVEDLASELREVRPIELQVIGAQLQTEKITTLEHYRKHWLKEKLVERFLEEVVKDCGLENERAAQLVLYLLTNENNTRPLKTRAELVKDLATEAQNLDLVLEILVGSGLVFRVLETPADRYQLVHDYLVPFIRQQRSAELLAKLKEAEEQQQRTQEELNRVLQKQLRDARRTGIGLAGLAAVASGFAIVSLLAFINGVNSQLNTLSAVSDGRLAYYQDMDALIEGIRAGKQIKWGKIGIPYTTKMRVAATLQSAVNGIREHNTLEGHSDSVTTVSFSPNGKFIASGSADKTIKLWNVQDQESKTFEGHKKSVTTVSFSPDGKFIASGSEDKTIKLWNIQSQESKTFEGHSESVTTVSFSPNGKLIASGSEDKTVRLWNLQGKLIETLKNYKGSIIHVGFSPDGKNIVSINKNEQNQKTITIWNIDTKKLKILNPDDNSSQDKIYGVVFRNHGQEINTIGLGALKLRLNHSILKKTTLPLLYSNNIYTYTKNFFNPNSEIWAAFDNGSSGILLYSMNPLVDSYSEVEALYGHKEDVTSLSFSPVSKMLASGSKDNTIKLWNIERRNFKTSDESQVKKVNFSLDGQIITSSSDKKEVQLWSRNGTLLTTLPGRNSEITFSKNSQTIASASVDNTVQLWRRDGTLLTTLQGEAIDGSFSPDEQTVALVKDDYSVELSTNNGKRVSTLKGHKSKIYKISFSRDGQTILTASKDKTIKLWKRDGTLLRTLEGYGASIKNMSLSPNGERLVILGYDNTVKFLRRDGKLIKTIPGQGNQLMEIQFSPDGEILVIRNQEADTNKVQIWKVDGTFIRTLSGEKNDNIYNTLFSSDSQKIGVEYRNNIQIWRRDINSVSTIETSDSLYNVGDKNIVTKDNNNINIWQANGQFIRIIPIKREGATDELSVSPDDQTIVIKPSEKIIELWRIDGTFLKSISIENEKTEYNNFSLSFSSDGKPLAIATGENKVKFWHINDNKVIEVSTLQKHKGSNKIKDTKFISNNEIVAIIGENETAKLWQIQQNKAGMEVKLLQSFQEHTDTITSVSISPTSDIVASASKDKTVKLWRHNGTLIKTLTSESDRVNSVTFSPNGETIASASDKTIKLWRSNGDLIKTFQGKDDKRHNNKINRVIFSPDGKMIASASDDKNVIIWKLDGTPIIRLKESYRVTGISFSFDGKMIASATSSTIKLWNVEDGELLSTYQRLGKEDVSFSPKEMTIAAAGNNSVAVWNFDLDELLKRGCNWAQDYLKYNPSVKKSDRQLCDDILNRK